MIQYKSERGRVGMKGACSFPLIDGAVVDSDYMRSCESTSQAKRPREDKDDAPPTVGPSTSKAHSTPTASTLRTSHPLAPNPMPASQKQEFLYHCSWVRPDGVECTTTGTSFEVWEHMCKEHGIKSKIVAKNAQETFSCGWPGCNNQGVPQDVAAQCIDVHKQELAPKGTSSQARVSCRYAGCQTSMGAGSLRRHLLTVHYEGKWTCDICGARMRSQDRYACRVHFGICLDDFMKTDPRFHK